jgi:hypothetical protein
MGVFSEKEKETLHDTVNKYTKSQRIQEHLAAVSGEVTTSNCKRLKTEISEDLAEIADYFKQAAQTGVDCQMQIPLVDRKILSFVIWDGIRINATLDEFYIEVYMDEYENSFTDKGVSTYGFYSSVSDGVHFAPYIEDTHTPFKSASIRDQYYAIVNEVVGKWESKIKPQIRQEITSRVGEKNTTLIDEIGINSNKIILLTLERLEKAGATKQSKKKGQYEPSLD